MTIEERLCRLEALHDIADPSCAPTALVIPETQPYDPNAPEGAGGSYEPRNLDQNQGFMFYVDCDDTPDAICDRNANGGTLLTRLVYMGHGMPYVYPGAVQGEHHHGWWVPGDRMAYECGYAFMYDLHPNPPHGVHTPREGHFISRVIITRPETQAYGKLNDKYMEEQQLNLDGTSWTADSSPWQCRSGRDDFDYANYVPHGPDDIRIGLFADNPLTTGTGDYVISDIRDHTNLAQTNPHHFEFLDFRTSDVPAGGMSRSTILMISGATGGVIEVLYYDTMNDGRMAVEVNGEIVAEG